MWQIICLCLPAVTRSEQQRLFALFSKALHAYGREPGEMDIGLFFLHSLSPEESLTVLEERLDLVVRSQELMERLPERESATDVLQVVIDDHMRTLLAAERAWLNRTLTHLRAMNAYKDQRVSDHV